VIVSVFFSFLFFTGFIANLLSGFATWWREFPPVVDLKGPARSSNFFPLRLMGNSQSSLLGRALKEVELFDHDQPDGGDRLWVADDFPDFLCWSGDFQLEKEILFSFLHKEVLPAKRHYCLPMSLFPSDPPGLQSPLEPRKEWEQPPTSGMDWHCLFQSAGELAVEMELLSTAVVVEACDTRNLAWCRRSSVAVLPVSSELSRNSSQQARPIPGTTFELVSISLNSSWDGLEVGDHVMYVDDYSSGYAMEHHYIVVSCTRGSSARPHVLCVGVSDRSRWIYASLTLMDLTRTFDLAPKPLTLLKIQACNFVNCSPPFSPVEAMSCALACIGLHGVWFGPTLNCEDWANWISTGYIFSVQRMRAVALMELSRRSLLNDNQSLTLESKDVLLRCSSPNEFLNFCPKLRQLRLAALPALQTHENFR
jgi:hypothetical protein